LLKNEIFEEILIEMSRRGANELKKRNIEFSLSSERGSKTTGGLPNFKYEAVKSRQRGTVFHQVGNISLHSQLIALDQAIKKSNRDNFLGLNQTGKKLGGIESGKGHFDFLTGLGHYTEDQPQNKPFQINSSQIESQTLIPKRYKALDGFFGLPALEYEKKGLLDLRLKLKNVAKVNIGNYPLRSRSADGKQGVTRGSALEKPKKKEAFSELYEVIEDREKQDPEMLKFQQIQKQKKGTVFKGSFDPEKALAILTSTQGISLGPTRPRPNKNEPGNKRHPLPFSFHSIITKHSQMYPEGAAMAIQKKYADQIALIKPNKSDAMFPQTLPKIKKPDQKN
jgi:hypothetical protein